MEISEVINTEPTAVEKMEKRRNTSFGLSLSNTTYRPSRRVPDISEPMEQGGSSCIKCGVLLPHDDYVGIPESRWFKVYGYHCHVCGNRWLNDKRTREEERKGQKYMTMGKWEIKRSSPQQVREPISSDEIQV
jgi:hypothetical protein